MAVSPDDSFETKAKHLRWLYRELHRRADREEIIGNDIYRALADEYERLFGERSVDGTLEHIVKDAWIEGRRLAGWTYDRGRQCWRRADGSIVHNDDGSEWKHL